MIPTLRFSWIFLAFPRFFLFFILIVSNKFVCLIFPKLLSINFDGLSAIWNFYFIIFFELINRINVVCLMWNVRDRLNWKSSLTRHIFWGWVGSFYYFHKHEGSGKGFSIYQFFIHIYFLFFNVWIICIVESIITSLNIWTVGVCWTKRVGKLWNNFLKIFLLEYFYLHWKEMLAIENYSTGKYLKFR